MTFVNVHTEEQYVGHGAYRVHDHVHEQPHVRERLRAEQLVERVQDGEDQDLCVTLARQAAKQVGEAVLLHQREEAAQVDRAIREQGVRVQLRGLHGRNVRAAVLDAHRDRQAHVHRGVDERADCKDVVLVGDV